ncbi:Similar to SCYL3: Protein-associating with the carboxyl-terminal domain of ezrin (Homo sapiens) [Cotesia congregata]|uniref:Similar to SCYL3: Protein-associating with the carboxyl-terminal domain of ezrin (Homo sapiens) n=1 Tax=Cotesia congregata TaxID=51543 RepID=A0A8J2HIV8_COTCN|nr:Similar to SCYL3: Protein-associating with the carboxyl-terminal domain of ezrin (Homo sapiens) [Cotesia congregata]
MGNEKSALSGLKIDEKAIEITDFWLHHSANLNGANSSTISVFISEPSLQSCPNFGSSYYLATEEVKPLAQVIGSQTTLQICIGLHSILRALIFLHEKALASHNNVCSSSIYVTPEGSWKLGGLEFLCRFTDFNQAYLKKIKNFRYEKAIAPEEDGNSLETQLNPIGIDQYAFGVLTEEVLRLKNSDDVPALAEFKEICKRSLQNPDPLLRTKLSTLLPKTEDNEEDTSLFTVSTFKSHLVPKLLQMFCVRDTSIRLLLLSHLNSFIYTFQIDELKNQILPELLVGIKDHDDHLVSVTLQALADLVPILGAAAVIGGKRAEEETTWSDWDAHEVTIIKTIDIDVPSEAIQDDEFLPVKPETSEATVKKDSLAYSKKTIVSDIRELDIKHSKTMQQVAEEVDFFTDMEPVIEKPKVVHIEQVKPEKSVFDVKNGNQDIEDDDGWVEDFDDWGDNAAAVKD